MNLLSGPAKIIKKVFGSRNERLLKTMQPLVGQINSFEPQVKALSDEALRAKTSEFKDRLAKGTALDDLLPEAFAVVREVGRRTINMRHFDSQLIGGIALHRGMIAEMATGEGKTLVATLPIYLNALEGKGVHLVTVNDYLAKRDRNWMGPIYEFLGLTVGVIQHDIKPLDRQAAYHSDITYGTNNEFGFDYLRDNMVTDIHDRVQRKLHYAIVDEVDSILVDEARTPLIISGPAEESTDKYYQIDRIIPRLEKNKDYEVDEKANTVTLKEEGIARCEELLGVQNIYENTQIDLIHHINQGLRAHTLFERDVDYMVKDGQVVIVDEFTGRLMPGRRFSDGLHQALEAKEKVKIERENQTLATVTFQNYFRMYKKLAGMTGTAATEAVEFDKIYKLDVLVVPTNKPVIRADDADCIYRTEREKFKAVVDEISELHKQGRPALVGTISIEKSEQLSKLLEKHALPHTVLNAKYHEREAEIIARAGQESAITIATNMAGRGTDIVLGPGVAERGGLHVVGTERHEARRIDNQLRGRCGRQGDKGSSRFYLSLEDDLMRIFGSDKISGLMQRLGMEEGQEIQHPLVTRAVETAQKRVEGRNFEIRKHLLEYDDVMNRQREIIYEERNRVLESTNLTDHIFEMIENVADELILLYVNPELREEERNEEGFKTAFRSKFGIEAKSGYFTKQTFDDWCEEITEQVKAAYRARNEKFGPERMHFLERYVMLQVIDAKWKDHLRAIDDLREGIYLRAYGQRDPLVEYKQESFAMFDQMTSSIKEEVIEFLFKVQAVREEEKVTTAMNPSHQIFLHPEATRMPSAQDTGTRNILPTDSGYSDFRGTSSPPASMRPPQEVPQPVRRDQPKVGRNEPCPCGSGKKYKKCHGA
ncbi:MAG: preprotein translocase subunit SecA [Omnitrophica bacterium RIFCSPHIGHO2_02_FULL_46_11]|nr:MAG: preprotein translocase subunit SecA [Omnitrophica bacterium RIFCSPLOWO2_01_FULL_45_10b]OGW87730.1 MAG: preprotein translocase subunit SecA [Omnitrophica bacterium RIFCSPHIGHO2_02_FULL_46_11]